MKEPIMKVTLSDFHQAYEVLKNEISPTPLVYNEWLTKKYGCEVYLKLENMLPVGSFKMRGATYKLSTLTDLEKKRGVLAVSAGNHAQGVAWAAQRFNLNAWIIMPMGSPITKIKNTEALGAKVILHGESLEDGFKLAETLIKEKKYTFIHPYADREVILGQGSIGFEVIEQLPDIDYLFSSIGGGGLVTGIGQVIKHLKPKVKIFAGQAQGASSMVNSLKAKKIIKSSKNAETFADGIRVKNAHPEMFKMLSQVVDEVESIPDNYIAWGVLELLEKARVLSEGAGALPLAMLDRQFQKDPKKFKGKKVVLVICGGNIDVNILQRIIDQGLHESQRKIRISVPIIDKPGMLHHLTGLIKEEGANVLEIHHDRGLSDFGLASTVVSFVLETKGHTHALSLIKKMKKEYPLMKQTF
jgi:threonine dehydratase